jgi:hypothetical protein
MNVNKNKRGKKMKEKINKYYLENWLIPFTRTKLYSMKVMDNPHPLMPDRTQFDRAYGDTKGLSEFFYFCNVSPEFEKEYYAIGEELNKINVKIATKASPMPVEEIFQKLFRDPNIHIKPKYGQIENALQTILPQKKYNAFIKKYWELNESDKEILQDYADLAKRATKVCEEYLDFLNSFIDTEYKPAKEPKKINYPRPDKLDAIVEQDYVEEELIQSRKMTNWSITRNSSFCSFSAIPEEVQVSRGGSQKVEVPSEILDEQDELYVEYWKINTEIALKSLRSVGFSIKDIVELKYERRRSHDFSHCGYVTDGLLPPQTVIEEKLDLEKYRYTSKIHELEQEEKYKIQIDLLVDRAVKLNEKYIGFLESLVVND